MNMDTPTLSSRDFARMGEFIQAQWGLKMPPAKKPMLEGRLAKRLRNLGLTSYKEYCDYLFGPEGGKDEIWQLVNLVTTNKTDFFREAAAFQFLLDHILPELMGGRRRDPARTIEFWCAGCSSGEEPYTLAMVLAEFSEKYIQRDIQHSFSILATDISTSVLDVAKRAVYSEAKIAPVPMEMRRKYLLRSKDSYRKDVRIVPLLRSMVRFRQLNLVDDLGMHESKDVIFCRNVIIYFNRETQQRLLARLCAQLLPGGYIITGHSETLNGMNLPVTQMAPTIHQMPC